MIIGLTGSLGAGKGVILEYLQSQGFNHLSTSNEVRDEARRRNIDLTRTNLQNLGNKLREKEGDSVLAKRLIAQMNSPGNYIVDGLRNPAEVIEMKNLKDFILIAVDAPSPLRFTRLMSRNRESDPKTWEEFLRIDLRDKGEGEQKSGQQSAACMELADFNIYNDGDIGSVHEEIKSIIHAVRELKKE